MPNRIARGFFNLSSDIRVIPLDFTQPFDRVWHANPFRKLKSCQIFYRVFGLQVCNFIKMRLPHRRFPVTFAKFLRTSFFYRTPPVAASDCVGLVIYGNSSSWTWIWSAKYFGLGEWLINLNAGKIQLVLLNRLNKLMRKCISILDEISFKTLELF